MLLSIKKQELPPISDTYDGNVDRSEAPFLPPMMVHEVIDNDYVVEAIPRSGNITVRVPKQLLTRVNGNLVVKEATAAAIMK